jgi:thioredoxin
MKFLKSNLRLFILILLAAGISSGLMAQEKKYTKNLNKQEFLDKVFNYEKNKDNWVFEGDMPVIVDFYADWCGPCKMVAPILEELGQEYEGKIKIYKVNTDKERELASVFGIRSIPSVLFVPMKGKPQMTAGALPKTTFKQVIDEFLLEKKPESK